MKRKHSSLIYCYSLSFFSFLKLLWRATSTPKRWRQCFPILTRKETKQINRLSSTYPLTLTLEIHLFHRQWWMSIARSCAVLFWNRDSLHSNNAIIQMIQNTYNNIIIQNTKGRQQTEWSNNYFERFLRDFAHKCFCPKARQNTAWLIKISRHSISNCLMRYIYFLWIHKNNCMPCSF